MIDRIITPQEFATFRNISKKLDEGKINEAIDLAQQSDLYDILGDFYFDVQKNKAEAEYEDLMNGSEFTYLDEEYEHSGIKALLADYTMSRISYSGNMTWTPFGLQKKMTEDSEAIDRNTMKDLSKQAQVDAGFKFKIIQKYLLSNPDDLFSRYCKSQNVGSAFFTQNFRRIRR